MTDWARERAKDVQRTLRFEQPFEQVENIADALREAETHGKETGEVEVGLAYQEGRTEERKAIEARAAEAYRKGWKRCRALIEARLREPDEAMVEAGTRALFDAMEGECLNMQLNDGSCKIHYCQCRREARAIIRAIADALDPLPAPQQENSDGQAHCQ